MIKEGASLGGILSTLQPLKNISFNFAILISGFPSEDERHKDIMKPKSIKNVASMHIYGVEDTSFNIERMLELAEVFENPIIMFHLGGRFTPKLWPTKSIKQ